MQLPPLKEARLLKRYKRFLADVRLSDGSEQTIHCPNTGSMLGCNEPGCRVWFSESDNPKRKYSGTWEIIENTKGHWVGIHTGRANELVLEGIQTGVIKELQGYDSIQREVKYGNENSRIDFLLTGKGRQCYVEVKNVTLGLEKMLGVFPDAVTTRGQKHLRELGEVVSQGHRGILIYCVQHSGIDRVMPAVDIDEHYSSLLKEVIDKGVEVYAYGADISLESIVLKKSLGFSLVSS